MAQQRIPINRSAVGWIALGCLAAAVGLEPWVGESSGLSLWQSALGRVGIVMGALWLALPGRNQDAPWLSLSPKSIAGLLIALIFTIRVPPRVLIPGAIFLGVIVVLLRPRPKKRPTSFREKTL
jgi:hypothetical protein